MLRYSRIKPITYEKCKQKYNESKNNKWIKGFEVHSKEAVICAFNDDGKDSCEGDSGGPFFHNTKPATIYGLVSYGKGTCGEYSVQYFFNLDRFKAT